MVCKLNEGCEETLVFIQAGGRGWLCYIVLACSSDLYLPSQHPGTLDLSSRYLPRGIFGNNFQTPAGEGQDPAGCAVGWIRGQNGGGREDKFGTHGREEQRGSSCGERGEERQIKPGRSEQRVDRREDAKLVVRQRTRKGILGFKGCSPASSYPPQVSYLVPPPGLSVASYSRVCRTYLCNNLTNMDAILRLKARTPKTLTSSSHSCPTCVGEHSKSCLPNFVSSESCPRDATKCYSSTVKFQAGFLNTTFLLMGCARELSSVLAHFHHIGSIRVTEVVNVIEKALFSGAGTPCQSPSWGILLGLLFAFKG
uniref:LY6/PLAUR domain containing 4 n=1 Tax=Ovis aries TaxID=9940 RepID=A0AC11EUT0_SHEEP